MNTEVIAALTTLLRHANQQYRAGTPFMSDYDYDRIEALLRKLDPDNSFLAEVG